MPCWRCSPPKGTRQKRLPPPPPHGGPLHSVEWVALPDLSSSRPDRLSELPLQLCGTCQVPYVPHCSLRTMYRLNADLLRIHYHVPDSRETSVRTRKTPCPWGLLFWWEADAAPGSADRCNCALWSSRALSFPGVWTCVTMWTRTRTSKEPCKTHCHLSCLLPSTYSFQPKAALLHNHSPSPAGPPGDCETWSNIMCIPWADVTWEQRMKMSSQPRQAPEHLGSISCQDETEVTSWTFAYSSVTSVKKVIFLYYWKIK